MDNAANPDRVSVTDCDDHGTVTSLDGTCILCLSETDELNKEGELALLMEKAKRGDEEAQDDLFGLLQER